ncbi:MAG: hypothetical protein RLZZ214_3406, partial [Verrucomicrobiota bacterium]
SGAATSGISGGPTAGRILTWSVGAKNLDTNYAGAISNGTSTTALTKVGTGIFTLSGTSAYTGATAVSGGALAVTGVLGATNVTVASGAKLTGSGSIGGLVTVQSGGTLGIGTGSPTTLGIAGGVALSGGSNLVMKLGSTTTAGGGVNDLIQMTAGTLSLSGTITVTPAYLNGTLIPGTYTLITGGAATTGTPTFVWGGTNGEVVSFSTSTPGTVTLVVAGAGPPAAPTGLVATAGNTQVALNWDAVAGATGYTVKRSLTSGSGYAPLPGGTTVNTSFTDTGLTNGTAYYYKVCATNGFGDGPDSSEAAATPASTVTTTFTSVAGQDGYVRESNETSNVGGSTTSNSTLRMGDDNSTQSGERQLKGFVSFDTSSLPDNAVVTSATLKVKSSAITGTSPFTTHGTCYADIKGGSGFGGATALANSDFEAAADATSVAVMSNPVSVGGISSGTLNAAARGWISKTATTQLRLYFSTDDNDNNADDWIDFYAGEDATAANRPVLELTYQVDGTSQTPTTLTVNPPGSTLAVNATQAFSATVLDQFGNPMSSTIAWSATGGGTINASGLFTATAAGGPYQITATSGSLSTGVPVTVTKATPTVSIAPTASSITYGQALSSSSLTGGTASVAGSFAFTNSGTTPNAGTAAQAVTFTPTDSANYATAATSASVTVNKATPTVSVVPTASAIIYGQALSSSSLSGGSASVAGSFAFTTPATIPDVGTASQAVTFTPTAAANYNTVTAAVSVAVNEGTAIYQVTNVYSGDGSEDVLFQNADGSLLNGGIVAIGSFPADYNIPSTASQADIASAVASFTPLASALCGGDSVSLGGSFPGYVEGASLAGVNPSSLIGRPLYVFVGNASTLAASTSIAIRQMDVFRPNNPPLEVHYGAYLVNLLSAAPAPRIGNVGTYTGLAWQWGEISTYQTLQLAGPSSATITTPPTASPITYGQSLASSTLSGGVGSVPGSFAFTTPGAMPGAGTASQEFTFTPTDTVTYATVTGMASVTVNKATATVTLGGLAATYDGMPHPVSATTTPTGLAVLLTYNGSATAPTVPGTYPVLADIADANHSGSTADTLVIAARSLENWVTGKFSPAQIAAGESAPSADPDHDGLTNLAEYALGGQPYAFTAQPAMTSDATSMSVTFQRPAWIGDVIYQAEAGDNFTTWAALTLEVLNPGSDPETVRATHTFPLPKPAKTFLRLRFEN